jgi:hypothetical protein
MSTASERNFYVRLYAGFNQSKTTLLHRNDDQLEGTVTAYTLYNQWAKRILHTGQPSQGSMGVGDSRGWLIARAELDRVGVNYINAGDVLVDETGRKWLIESGDNITIQLNGDYLDISTKRIV